ncbi:MAG: 4Fe-4S binding protein [Kofleriaceae bacterium]|nr:4Fe-4S binding protein [Kofleriaceae bacterium]MBP9169064.1 4Fe-4S binding protein [Kofleriaceae bacterium]MBP9858759.1 4Fe-4S binding protein [Kofleriaceae bacterium]
MSMPAGDPSSMLAPVLRAGYAQIRQLPLFDGLPNDLLIQTLASGDLTWRQVDRDVILADPASAAGVALPVMVLVAGQIAVGVFDAAELAERREAQDRLERMTHDERESVSLIKPIPMARLAKKNIALFTDGDLWNAGAVTAARGAPCAFYATAPSTVLTLSQRLVADIAVRFPFFEARFRRAIQLARARLHGITGVKQEILDFFVRQGISVSGESVRVRQLDRCIDCKQCEIACEERYGAKRLTLGGYQLGMLDFVYTCRTCTDQRCIDPCAYDSIKYDPGKKEVVINEATCTGCSACAQSCPYGAIDMIDVEDGSPAFNRDFRARLEKKQALAFGPGTGRVARVRRVANKCDHCGAYGDQACVSACPTGALIELSAYDLFRERSPAIAAAARAGFDQELDPDRREVLPTHPFTEGVDERSGGAAKVRRGRWGPLLLWTLGILAFLVALAEILLRSYAPTLSYQYAQLRATPELASLPAELIVQKVGFRSGNPLAIQCGLIGTGLMIIAAIYPLFRRLKAFRWLASNTMWFDFHLMAGTVGPMFVALHSALKLSSWVSLAFWSMVIVTISGFIGRYLYTQVPELSSGRELEQLDHERAFALHRVRAPLAMTELDREVWEHGQRAGRVAAHYGLLASLVWLLVEDLRRPGRWLARRSRLAKLGVAGKVRRELVRRTGRLLMIQRGLVIAPKANLLLNSWKKVHVPFTVLLTIFSAAHIYISWDRAW